MPRTGPETSRARDSRPRRVARGDVLLRALGRRLASVPEGGLREFLDGEFDAVYDWVDGEAQEIDPNQARAGWRWLLKA
ncbi:MAG: hypothetical protein ACO3NL_11430, partial [Phycisphaerales bacterium]